jgi:hypothetical protein
MESIQIYLNSKNADKYYESISNCEYNLPPIEIPDGFHIYLSVQNVTIPYSFYNINDSNNLLSYLPYEDFSININYYDNNSINYFLLGVYDYYTYILSDDEGHILYNSDLHLNSSTLLVSNLKSSVVYTLIILFNINGITVNKVINQITSSGLKTIVNSIPIRNISKLILSNGNYNITQLLDYLILNMIGFTITYNPITNKLTFLNSNNFIFLKSSTCYSVLGFDQKNNISSSLSLISSNCVNIMNVKRINVVSNFISYNIDKASLNNYSILCSIPINKPAYSLIEYNNTNNFRTNLFLNLISLIKIKLTDENGQLIDLNGNNYCITLQLDIEPFN